MSTCVGCSAEIAVTASFCERCGTPNPESPTVPTPTGGGVTERIPPDELRQRLQKALTRDLLIDRMIGEGGFAVVFAVQDRKLSRRIAVKVLRPELTASKSTVQRFIREAELVAGLSHPHILPIFFVGEGEGLVYFGMPFVEGETLEARLTREPQLPEAEVVRMGAEIADALAEAHAAGLVHRDVKPANVLLQGTRSRVLVADFGIAKAASGSGNKLTGTGSVIGSPHYMSPEQAAGSEQVDHRSDIYSLGIVLWQMLAGAMPFDAPDTQGILVQHLTQPLPPLARKRPGVSPALARIVERCCAKRPEDRFQSVAEVAQALRTGAAPPLSARRPGRVVISLAAVLLVTLLAVLIAKLRTRHAGGPAVAATTDTLSVREVRSVAPRLAVLPFVVTGLPDTAQWARQAATSVAAVLEDSFGVATVDINRLLGEWSSGAHSVEALLDSNAAFVYRRFRANQLVLGRVVHFGNQVRVSADAYDTRTLERIGRVDLSGDQDSLFVLLDRLAQRVAGAFCRQPHFNPRQLCFDVAARPRTPVVVPIAAAPVGDTAISEVAFHVLVSSRGALVDLRTSSGVPAVLVSAADPILRAARYEPARKGRIAVEAWTTVTVRLQGADSTLAGADPRCESPAFGVANVAGACFDARPVPRVAPLIPLPPGCANSLSSASLLVRVSARGEVIGRPAVRSRSGCHAFDSAATALMLDMSFAPARKAGTAVAGWVVVLAVPPAR